MCRGFFGLCVIICFSVLSPGSAKSETTISNTGAWNETSSAKGIPFNYIVISCLCSDSPSEWPKDIDATDRGDKFVTRCRLRSYNYWNYTDAQPKLVLGHQFESALGVGQNYLSTTDDMLGGEREVPIHRHKRRLFSIFNPFFLSQTEPYSRSTGNYVLVNRKMRPEKSQISPVKRERLIVDSQCSLVFIYSRSYVIF